MRKLVPLICLLFLTVACDRYAPIDNEMPVENIQPAANQSPIIIISATPTSGAAPLTALLNISASDPDGYVTKTECDFKGDGTYIALGYTGYLQYTYDTPGTYNLICRTTDNKEAVTNSAAQAISVNATPGTLIKTIPYPAGVTGISDVVFDSSSQSLLIFVYDTLNNWMVTKIIQVNPLSGETLNTTNITNPVFFMNHASEFTRARDCYYGTSYGSSNGVPQSLIYKIDLNGNTVSSFPCPATNTGGFCEGLAWDGTYLWSGASDNKNIVKFSIDGIVQQTITPFNTISIMDIAYDNGKLIVSKENNYIYLIEPQNGAIINQFGPYAGYTKKGDWDEQLFWFINSSTQEIEGTYIW